MFVRLDLIFLNSLIIHQVKTKKITTVKEVWIPSLNKHRFWRFYFSVYSLVFVSIEKIYQAFQTVFHRLSKHLEFRQKYSAARRIFKSLLGVWISRWNTVSRVWYITWLIRWWTTVRSGGFLFFCLSFFLLSPLLSLVCTSLHTIPATCVLAYTRRALVPA